MILKKSSRVTQKKAQLKPLFQFYLRLIFCASTDFENFKHSPPSSISPVTWVYRDSKSQKLWFLMEFWGPNWLPSPALVNKKLLPPPPLGQVAEYAPEGLFDIVRISPGLFMYRGRNHFKCEVSY